MKRSLKNYILLFILMIGILSIPIQCYLIYQNSLILLENNEYDLNDILSASNLTESKIYREYNFTSKCFESGDRIEQLNLNDLDSVLNYVSYFPYLKENDWLSPETTLEKGGGNCMAKSCLFCTLLNEINYPCLVAVSREHAICLVNVVNFWRPFDTTGYILSSNQLNEFFNNLIFIKGKNIYYG